MAAVFFVENDVTRDEAARCDPLKTVIRDALATHWTYLWMVSFDRGLGGDIVLGLACKIAGPIKIRLEKYMLPAWDIPLRANHTPADLKRSLQLLVDSIEPETRQQS
jgi:hypothetical protein